MATIMVLREHEFEYEFLVEVSLDRDGDVEALVAEDVPLRVWNRCNGYAEIEQTDHMLYTIGDDIELTEEEDEEAREAVAQERRTLPDYVLGLREIHTPRSNQQPN